MPSSLFARVDLDQLYIPFLQRVLEVIASCRELGSDYWATVGYRTPAEQAKLYFQGRTAPGPRVTNATAYESPHNYGLAVDFCHDSHLDIPGLQPDWGAPEYDLLGRETRRAGLVWGGDFQGLSDRPHVQWPGYVTAGELAPLKVIYQANPQAPLSAVFDHLKALEGPHV